MDSIKSLEPYFEKQKCAIAVSSSNEYSKYLCVYLMSIKAFADSNKYYDIVVFERDITDENKEKIKLSIESNNISVRFFSTKGIFDSYNLYITHSYFKEECYFRLVAPVILNSYEKIIFTDLDLILNDDILKLADIDLGDNVIAAAIEPIWRELYDCDLKINGWCIKDYADNVLKLSDKYEYYNMGVCVFNVQKYNLENSFEKIMKNIGNVKYLYQEQCALNYYFKNRILKLPEIWNFEVDPTIINNNRDILEYTEYKKQDVNAKIIHFLGPQKPWKNPYHYKSYLWWNSAKNTVFYEQILYDMMLSESKKHLYNERLHYVIENIMLFRYKKFEYKIKKLIFQGKKREKYKNKYENIKQLIVDAKNLKKYFIDFNLL